MRTTSEENKTAVAELRRARFLLATGQRYCTEALSTHSHLRVAVVPRGFGAIIFITSDTRYGH